MLASCDIARAVSREHSVSAIYGHPLFPDGPQRKVTPARLTRSCPTFTFAELSTCKFCGPESVGTTTLWSRTGRNPEGSRKTVDAALPHFSATPQVQVALGDLHWLLWEARPTRRRR